MCGGCRILNSEIQFKFLDVKLKLMFPERTLYPEVFLHYGCYLMICVYNYYNIFIYIILLILCLVTTWNDYIPLATIMDDAHIKVHFMLTAWLSIL